APVHIKGTPHPCGFGSRGRRLESALAEHPESRDQPPDAGFDGQCLRDESVGAHDQRPAPWAGTEVVSQYAESTKGNEDRNCAQVEIRHLSLAPVATVLCPGAATGRWRRLLEQKGRAEPAP